MYEVIIDAVGIVNEVFPIKSESLFLTRRVPKVKLKAARTIHLTAIDKMLLKLCSKHRQTVTSSKKRNKLPSRHC